MAYLLFVDESGQDHRASPYEVLAGAAVHDAMLWDLVCDVADAETHMFGSGFSDGARELLKPKTFRLAAQLEPFDPDERARLAGELLADPANPTRQRLTALAQAKIAFAYRVLELCATHSVRFFASIVQPASPRPKVTGLRKDYGYLFERFFYFVDEQPSHERGLVVFDELEKSQSHVLIGQMGKYFRETQTGRLRSGRVVPAPFFVHSGLTAGVRIADLVAYVISWNVRVLHMDEPVRSGLSALGGMVLQMRHRSWTNMQGFPDRFSVWSFAVIDDLRSRDERQGSLL